MATTRWTDLVLEPEYGQAILQAVVDRSRIRNSGIVGEDPRINDIVGSGANELILPSWARPAGPANASTDDPAQTATPKKIAQASERAFVLHRNDMFQAADLARFERSGDPLMMVDQESQTYWLLEEQRDLVATLTGVFAAASMAGNLLALHDEDPLGVGTPGYLDAGAVNDAVALLGDYSEEPAAMIVHPTVLAALKTAQGVSYDIDPVTGQRVPVYNNLEVIPSISAPSRAGTTSGMVYTSWIAARGALAYAMAPIPSDMPVAYDRNEAAGNGGGVTSLHIRRSYLIHPRGVSYTGTPAAAYNPTTTELATGTNWTRRWDPDLIPIVQITTNG